MKVPFVDLTRFYPDEKPDIEAALLEVVSSGIFLMGERTAEFERRLKLQIAPNREGHFISCNS